MQSSVDCDVILELQKIKFFYMMMINRGLVLVSSAKNCKLRNIIFDYEVMMTPQTPYDTHRVVSSLYVQ